MDVKNLSEELSIAISTLQALSVAEGNKEREMSRENKIELIEEVISLVKKAQEFLSKNTE